MKYASCAARRAVRSCAALHAARTQSTLVADPVADDALGRARPFHDIPGPKGLPLIGNLHRYLPLVGEYSKAAWHEAGWRKFERYGPLVREQIAPGVCILHLYDPKDMAVVSRNEGKYPHREFFVAMRKLREGNPDIYSSAGVAAANGESWHHLRTRVQAPMMRPQIMRAYLPQMNVIADDLVRRVRLLRHADTRQVPDLIQELFKWALESVTFILFNKRLGCLSDDLSHDSMPQQYIRAVNQFFQLTAKVELASFPLWRLYPNLSPSFRQLRAVHDFFFEHAMEYVQGRLSELQQGEGGEQQSLMEMMLATTSPRDASVMAVDAMAAGIDTTSLTLAYVLRNLAANPEAQRKLQEEVDHVLPNKSELTHDVVQNMPYLKACIKESMRINPTVQGTSRTLDKDIVLSGYRVPAGTLMLLNYYVSSKQERFFPQADRYVPERWLRDSADKSSADKSSADPFAFVPFGFGPRMCIGRRIAELEMYALLTKLMQNFWIENKNDDLKVRFQLVLMISSRLEYEFHERSSRT